MKPIFFVLGAALLSASPTTSLFARSKKADVHTQTSNTTTLKVLLHDQSRSLLVEVKGGYKAICPATGKVLASGFSTKRATMKPGEQGIFWGELLQGTYGMKIIPDSSDTAIFVNGVQYKGFLEVYDTGGALQAINEVDMESYLKSCLALDFLELDNTEVLNALAITARTDAYYQMEENKAKPWHVQAKDSKYKGYAVTLQHPALEDAIMNTKNAVMTYQGKPFATGWAENSAGKTASFSSMHQTSSPSPKGSNLNGMVSERLKSAWSFQMAKKEIANLAKLAAISDISTFSEEESGKVYAVNVKSSSGERTLDFATLQNVVGKEKLKSNDFTVEVTDDSVRFKGYGEGSGIGLCLHSASLMAKKGLNAKQILAELFSDTSLEKMPPKE
jgi:stage II sporulation protein D